MELPKQEAVEAKKRPMKEVIHEEWAQKYSEAGVSIPDMQEVFLAIESKDKNIVNGNCELMIDGVKVSFPQTWQNGWAILEKVYSTVLESKKSN